MRFWLFLLGALMLALSTLPHLRSSYKTALAILPRPLRNTTASLFVVPPRLQWSQAPVSYRLQHSMASELSAGSSGLQDALPKTTTTANNNDLPELSPADFRLYNKLADLMEYYRFEWTLLGRASDQYTQMLRERLQHNHFRHTWNTLHTATTTNKRPQGMSIRQFIQLGRSFVHSLTMHHNIEETYVFPMLARKMPKFRAQDHLKKQHEAIHEGLDKFEEYLSACQSGERELRLVELGEVMNTFGKVLWQHLDDEVNELKAGNMRKFWTTDEMRRLEF